MGLPRYRLRVFHKRDYTEPATLTTWMEPYRQPVLVKQNLRIHQHGALAAQGKLESVVFNLVRQRPLKLTAIDFPEGMKKRCSTCTSTVIIRWISSTQA